MGKYQVHVIDGVSDAVLADYFKSSIGTLNRSLGCEDFNRFKKARTIIRSTPKFFIGECSWFRNQVPDEIRQIDDLLGRGQDPVEITHGLIVEIMLIIDGAPDYTELHKLIGASVILHPADLEQFLFDNLGKRVIPITWTE